jgi:hypothetical protein
VRGMLSEARTRGAEALELSRQAHDAAGIADALLILADLEIAESLPQRRRRALAQEPWPEPNRDAAIEPVRPCQGPASE